MNAQEKSEPLQKELLRNSELQASPPTTAQRLIMKHGQRRLSLQRGNTWKLTVPQCSFRDWCSDGQAGHERMASHYSDETVAEEKSRREVETVT